MNLPEEAARRFENTYKKEVSITKCMAKVRKRFPKLEARSERIKMVNYSHDKEGMGRRESQEMRPKWASQRDTGDHGEVARDESGKVCYKCTKKGHFANQCKNRPYCNFCNIPGHSYRDCRKRKGQSRSYPEPGSGRQGTGKPSLHEKGSKKGQVKRVSANDPSSCTCSTPFRFRLLQLLRGHPCPSGVPILVSSPGIPFGPCLPYRASNSPF